MPTGSCRATKSRASASRHGGDPHDEIIPAALGANRERRMLIGTADSLEHLGFEGPLSLWQAVLLGCLIAVAAYWTSFRVPSRARRRTAPIVWFIRTAVAALIVWMLLGPVRETIERHVEPRSLAIVTDVSASMETIDPIEPKTELRW